MHLIPAQQHYDNTFYEERLQNIFNPSSRLTNTNQPRSTAEYSLLIMALLMMGGLTAAMMITMVCYETRNMGIEALNRDCRHLFSFLSTLHPFNTETQVAESTFGL